MIDWMKKRYFRKIGEYIIQCTKTHVRTFKIAIFRDLRTPSNKTVRWEASEEKEREGEMREGEGEEKNGTGTSHPRTKILNTPLQTAKRSVWTVKCTRQVKSGWACTADVKYYRRSVRTDHGISAPMRPSCCRRLLLGGLRGGWSPTPAPPAYIAEAGHRSPIWSATVAMVAPACRRNSSPTTHLGRRGATATHEKCFLQSDDSVVYLCDGACFVVPTRVGGWVGPSTHSGLATCPKYTSAKLRYALHWMCSFSYGLLHIERFQIGVVSR